MRLLKALLDFTIMAKKGYFKVSQDISDFHFFSSFKSGEKTFKC